MSKTFFDEISSAVAEENGSFAPKILYEMCDERLHPWGGEGQLKDKLRIVCGVYELNLRENYLCYGQTEKGARHAKIDVEAAIAERLTENAAYGAFVEKIASLNRVFAFDGSAADLGLFQESVSLVFELNALLSYAVTSYDKMYHQPERDRSNFYALSSRLLHLHRPKAFFPFGKELQNGTMSFLNANGCRLGEAELCGADREELAAVFCVAIERTSAVKGEEIPSSPKQSYLRAAALEYALCCYLIRHGIAFEAPSPIALSVSLTAKFKRIKTREEIRKIAEELKDDMPIEEARLYCCDAVEFEQVFMARCALGRK